MSTDTPNIDWGSDDSGFEEEAEGPTAPGDCGPYADDYDNAEKPRREQMNVKIAYEVKRAFKEQADEDNREMQYVVEDLIRLYLRDRNS